LLSWFGGFFTGGCLTPPTFFNTGELNRQVLINCKEIICTSLAELVPELCCIYRLSIYKDGFTDILVKYLKWLVRARDS